MMPLPLILGIGAAVAAAAGVATGIKGAIDTKEASDTVDAATRRNDRNLALFNTTSNAATSSMEKLGELEMTVAKDFERFSRAFEKIKNRPEFSKRELNADIPKFNFDEIHAVAIAANALFGAAAGGATGVVFGTAAAAGTTAAVMALGTASTGTAIASLSGAAATNAALAVLGGGTLAGGGGGIALGSALLGASTLGVGLLVGGVIFAFTGSKIKDKADDAYRSMLKNEEQIKKSVAYLTKIGESAEKFKSAVNLVYKIYDRKVVKLTELVNRENDWNNYTSDERWLVENNVCVVTVLHKMINTPLLKVTDTDSDGNPTKTEANTEVVDQSIYEAMESLESIHVSM
jgi:hypothetical protein